MGLDHFTTRAKRALGDRSKDHGTHNAPLFLSWNFMVFKTRENTVLLSLGCENLKGLGELMRILNASEGEVHWDTKRVGSASFPTCLQRMVP